MNKQTRDMVQAAFERLDCLNNISMTRRYRSELAELCRVEEVQHRKGTGGSRGYTENVADTVALFVVRDLARFATGECEMPTMKDALGLRSSYLLAAMLYANFPMAINRALGTDVQALAKLDYVKECCK